MKPESKAKPCGLSPAPQSTRAFVSVARQVLVAGFRHLILLGNSGELLRSG